MDEIVAVRLPKKDLESIEGLVGSGAWRNRSDFIRFAVKSLLERELLLSGPSKIGAPEALELGWSEESPTGSRKSRARNRMVR